MVSGDGKQHLPPQLIIELALVCVPRLSRAPLFLLSLTRLLPSRVFGRGLALPSLVFCPSLLAGGALPASPS